MKINTNPKSYHPPMHTAEHILNATMVKMFDCERSFSNHIERKKSKCDYHFKRDLTEAEISEINKLVNETILLELDVIEVFMSRNEAAQKFNLIKLPSEAGDTLRVINIGDYDSCLCNGHHVKNTNEIGEFRITTTTFDDGVLRIRYKLKTRQLKINCAIFY